MPNSYNVGDRVDTSALFTVTGVLTDPTTVSAVWGRSGAAPTNTWVYGTDAQIAKVGVGIYSAAIYITASMTGSFYYEYYGTTACHAAASGVFEVARNWR